jgi:hypothetical protein
MNLPDILEANPPVNEEVLLDLEVNFADDSQAAFLQKVVVGQDAARNGILNGHDCPFALLLAGCYADHFPEARAGDDLDLWSKKLPRSYLVKTAFIALNGNPPGNPGLAF